MEVTFSVGCQEHLPIQGITPNTLEYVYACNGPLDLYSGMDSNMLLLYMKLPLNLSVFIPCYHHPFLCFSSYFMYKVEGDETGRKSLLY